MSAPNSVLGVSGVCWVDFSDPTQVEAFYFAGSGRVCWVCWVFTRARACATSIPSVFKSELMDVFFLHARANKPNKPNTPNTVLLNSLIFKGFVCVGFVSGSVFSVLGSDLMGVAR